MLSDAADSKVFASNRAIPSAVKKRSEGGGGVDDGLVNCFSGSHGAATVVVVNATAGEVVNIEPMSPINWAQSGPVG